MWHAMRILRTFDLKQLLAHSYSADYAVVAQARTHRYYLEKAEYVKRVPGSDPDSRTFRLLLDKWQSMRR